MLERLRRLREGRARRKLERLVAENLRLRAQWREFAGDEPVELTPEERTELKALRDRAGPEAIQALGLGDVFHLDDDHDEDQK